MEIPRWRWRPLARMVAWMDYLITVIEIFVTIWYAYHIALLTSWIRNQPGRLVGTKLILLKPWALIAFSGISTFCELWAAIKLLKATNAKVELVEDLQRAQIWRKVNILFLCIGFVANGLGGRYIHWIISSFLKGTFLAIVWKFTNELEKFQLETVGTLV